MNVPSALVDLGIDKYLHTVYSYYSLRLKIEKSPFRRESLFPWTSIYVRKVSKSTLKMISKSNLVLVMKCLVKLLK
jgi:hypothetical protein